MVDQSDSLIQPNLQALLSADTKTTATTKIFLCPPSCVGRFSFSGIPAAVLELLPLCLSDARNYLQDRASSMGRPDLFTSEASDLIIDGSRGLPGALRSIAHLAFFGAASEGASQVNAQHVAIALESPDSLNVDGDTRQTSTASRVRPAHIVDKASLPAARRANKKGKGEALGAPPDDQASRALPTAPSRATAANYSPL